MARKFISPDYETTLNIEVKISDCVPPHHLARFVVMIIDLLDLTDIYDEYGKLGAPPYAPEILLALLFYGYATGVFSSRKLEKATYESIPFRFISGDMHPDHDTIAGFRKRFLSQIQELFVQILLVAQTLGIFELGNISIDGSKIHADASKSKAVSYKRLLALEAHLQTEVAELLALAEEADKSAVPEGMVIKDEVTLRQTKLTRLAEAKAVLKERAQFRYEAEKAAYEARMKEREAKEKEMGRKLPGSKPQPPILGPRDKDQYNFTDPESRIMKNSANKGVDQHYNVQVGVDHDSRLIVANGVSDHPNDKQEALPTLDAIPNELGRPKSANLDNGYFSEGNINGILARGVEPYIATGRDPHHKGWRVFFAQQSDEPKKDASPKEKMAYKLRTEIGNAIYRLRKSTVEPVIGIIKEVLGFRQFSLRGLKTVGGEWSLVCIAYNLKRMHTLKFG